MVSPQQYIYIYIYMKLILEKVPQAADHKPRNSHSIVNVKGATKPMIT